MLVSAGLSSAGSAQEAPPASASDNASNSSSSPIVVVAKRRGVTESVDRTTYDVHAGADGASLNAIDVLKRLPGVTVGPSETITIRGGERVAYLIDGRPVRQDIALAVPASQIERVEVIADPSVDLDLAGQAIINLILKKNAKAGWSGTVSAQGDTNGGVKAGADFANGGGIWTLNGNVSFRSTPSTTRSSSQTAYVSDSNGTNDQLTQIYNHTRTDRVAGQIKLYRKAGDNDTSLTIGGNYNIVPGVENESVSEGGSNSPNNYNSVLRFHGLYPFLNFSANRDLGSGFSLQAGLDVDAGLTRTSAETDGDIDQSARQRLNFVYAEPSLTIKKSLKSGIVSIGTVFSANPVTDRLAVSGAVISGDPINEASDFHFNRNEIAGFISYDGKLIGFDVKPALRIQGITQTFSDGGENIPGLHDYSKLLPSFHISRKIGRGGELKASFTSRIEVPDAMNLDPFDYYKSPLLIERGNTYLRPSDKKQFDLSYSYHNNSWDINNSLFYRRTKDDVGEYSIADNSDSTITSYVNASSSREYGYSFTGKAHLNKRVELGLGVDVYHKIIVAPTSLGELGRSRFVAVNLNSTLDFALDSKDALSAQFSYQGRTLGLGVDVPSYFTSELKFKRDITKRITFNAYLENTFIPLKQHSRFYGIGLNGSAVSREDTRLFRVSVASSF